MEHTVHKLRTGVALLLFMQIAAARVSFFTFGSKHLQPDTSNSGLFCSRAIWGLRALATDPPEGDEERC